MTTGIFEIAFLLLLTAGWFGLCREVYRYIKETKEHVGPKTWDTIVSLALVIFLTVSLWSVIVLPWVEIIRL